MRGADRRKKTTAQIIVTIERGAAEGDPRADQDLRKHHQDEGEAADGIGRAGGRSGGSSAKNQKSNPSITMLQFMTSWSTGETMAWKWIEGCRQRATRSDEQDAAQ